MSPQRTIRAIVRSPALMTAAIFGASGAGFAIGNVLLARLLPPSEYGYLALFLSLTQLGFALGPLGMETVINRHHLPASDALLRRGFATGALTGVGLAALAWLVYGVTLPLAIVLSFAVLAVTLNRMAGALFQTRQQFGTGLFLTQIHNWVLLCGVPVVLWLQYPKALPVVLLTVSGYAVTAYVGWRKAWRDRDDAREWPAVEPLFREGLSIVGLQLAVGLIFQLDRLLIPKLLSISDLATYSVVAAVAASPFRMLQTGVGYSLLPRLRACETAAQIRRLVAREAAVILLVSIAAAAIVVVLMPWITTTVLAGRYEIPASLITAVIVVGFVRVWNSFASSSVHALGSVRHLALLNLCSWIAVGLAALGAMLAQAHGLTGLVYGIGAGRATLALAATFIALHASRGHR